MAGAPRHVALVAGTRPELIKLAPVLLELRRRPEAFRATLVVTAQHREMLDQVAAAFDITPDVDLDLMRPDQTLAELTARVVTGVQETLARLRPDAVLVHGDTTTCLASALAAFYEGIPVGHVEAGLRTYDMSAPWPEEMNRRLTDHLCRWCFAPTALAAGNLEYEGIPGAYIIVTGNTVVDALLLALARIGEQPHDVPGLEPGALDGRRLVLVTGHRRESFGEPLRELCGALRALADRHEDVVLVYPVHMNPNVAGPVAELLGGHDRIKLIAPLPYLPFVALMARASLIISDSGGVQEEAPTLGVPVLVTRFATERPEALEAGVARLVGTLRTAILEGAAAILSAPAKRRSARRPVNPYGDGRAAQRIADALAESFSEEPGGHDRDRRGEHQHDAEQE
jgi:UDP-N-acetylglucosamine 2-epimerase (hydrolysing)